MRSRRFDLSLREEALVGLVFLAAFFVARGLYGLIPMLMAGTIAVLAAFGAHKLLRLALDQHVRLGPVQLRHGGALTMGGRSFIFITVILIALLGHSAAVRLMLWRAGTLDDRVTVPYAAVAAGEPISPEQLAIARDALRWYRWSASVTRGGIALSQTPEATVRMAWLNLVLGHPDAAIEELGHLVRSGRGNDHAAFEWGRLIMVRGGPVEAVRALETVARAYPDWSETRDLLCSIWIAGSESPCAFDLYHTLLSRRPLDFAARVGLSRAFWATNHREEALREAAQAASDAPREPLARSNLAQMLFQAGRTDEALSELDRAASVRPASGRFYCSLGVAMLRQIGRNAQAAEWERRVHPHP
jgi:tetratricopeptide (TPR) repeat protein